MEATKNVLQWFVTLKRGKRGDAKFTNDSRPAAQRRAISFQLYMGYMVSWKSFRTDHTLLTQHVITEGE